MTAPVLAGSSGRPVRVLERTIGPGVGPPGPATSKRWRSPNLESRWADVEYRLLRGVREGWWERAACRGIDVEVFFPLPNDIEGVERALRVCERCPVRAGCLHYAITNREVHGIWGGTTETQRAAFVRRGRDAS
jgi:hypothetical protein